MVLCDRSSISETQLRSNTLSSTAETDEKGVQSSLSVDCLRVLRGVPLEYNQLIGYVLLYKIFKTLPLLLEEFEICRRFSSLGSPFVSWQLVEQELSVKALPFALGDCFPVDKDSDSQLGLAEIT